MTTEGDVHLRPEAEALVPYYFFDIHNGNYIRDDEGRECADFEAARILALQTLPEIARWEVSSGSERQTFSVLVRDHVGRPVYTSTLTLEGQRLG